MARMVVVEAKQRIDVHSLENLHLLEDPKALRSHVLRTIFEKCRCRSLFDTRMWDGALSSTVMLLLGMQTIEESKVPEISIILNKRSRKVRQAGDLCCPGGTVEAQLDPWLAKLLSFPGTPLSCWPYWACFRRKNPQAARLLSLLLATGIRESWEEMRLSPFCIRFLGPLPSQRLLLFRRVIHPMVGWVRWQERFILSWEVEKIVSIPLRSLLNPAHYARYRLYVPPDLEEKFNRGTQDFPCFIHATGNQTEVLWGATFRIVTLFMELVFGFKPPEVSSLPLVPGILDEGYIFGRE